MKTNEPAVLLTKLCPRKKIPGGPFHQKLIDQKIFPNSLIYMNVMLPNFNHIKAGKILEGPFLPILTKDWLIILGGFWVERRKWYVPETVFKHSILDIKVKMPNLQKKNQ